MTETLAATPPIVICSCGLVQEGAIHQPEHLTVGSQSACIDVAIVPLVRWVWELGLETRFSCQDNSRYFDVSFFDAADLETAYLGLLDLMEGGDPCLRHRAVGLESAPDDDSSTTTTWHTHPADTCWDFQIWPRVRISINVPTAKDGHPEGNLNFRIKFPVAGLAAVTALANTSPN
jgi:hypothetical protein